MTSPFKNILNFISEHFRKDASKMLIWTGVAGWTLSSLAQIGAVLFNSKISDEKKSFLIPQELADAIVNIGGFFLITQFTKNLTGKLFSTGKFAPKKVLNYLEKNNLISKHKIGKLDTNLDLLLKKAPKNIENEYFACKDFGKTVATIGAGIFATNIVTPVIRNNMAAKIQKNYMDAKKTTSQPTFKSHGLKI